MDIRLLAEHFLSLFTRKYKKNIIVVTPWYSIYIAEHTAPLMQDSSKKMHFAAILHQSILATAH